MAEFRQDSNSRATLVKARVEAARRGDTFYRRGDMIGAGSYPAPMEDVVDDADIAAFARDGAVCIRRSFSTPLAR